MMKYYLTYRLLKAAGHGPEMAHAILLDAQRGSSRARRWIRIVFSQRRTA